MLPNLTYLVIDLGAFIVPFLFSFHPKLKFYKEWRFYWPANAIVSILFLVWDAIYTKKGVWGFNDHYILGVKLWGLPLEEILFFVCIPYASIYTYHCIKLFRPNFRFQYLYLSFAMILTLLIVGIINYSKLYTSVTFISLSLLLSVFVFKRMHWLSHFFLMYSIILIPFFIVNGILTGTGIDSPVVWYNNSENLSMRVLTIPVEDFFYGMLLLLLNTFLFEQLRKKDAH